MRILSWVWQFVMWVVNKGQHECSIISLKQEAKAEGIGSEPKRLQHAVIYCFSPCLLENLHREKLTRRRNQLYYGQAKRNSNCQTSRLCFGRFDRALAESGIRRRFESNNTLDDPISESKLPVKVIITNASKRLRLNTIILVKRVNDAVR